MQLTHSYFLKANTVKFITLNPVTAQKVQNIANRLWLSGILFSITHAVFKVGSQRTSHLHSVST